MEAELNCKYRTAGSTQFWQVVCRAHDAAGAIKVGRWHMGKSGQELKQKDTATRGCPGFHISVYTAAKQTQTQEYRLASLFGGSTAGPMMIASAIITMGDTSLFEGPWTVHIAAAQCTKAKCDSQEACLTYSAS